MQPLRHPRMQPLRHPRMQPLRHPRLLPLCHPRMLLSGDLHRSPLKFGKHKVLIRDLPNKITNPKQPTS